VSNWRVKLATTVIKYLAATKARSFTQALQNPELAQQRILKRITQNLRQSSYGKALKLTQPMQYGDFKKHVPIVNYEALSPWIEQQKQGVSGVLTPTPVIFFEKTSGSSGVAKYIPYTKTLFNSFNNLFSLWAHDVVSNGPRLESGKIFMSVSPAHFHEKMTAAGIPIGLHNDSHYLQKLWQTIIKPFLVSPPKYEAKSIAAYRYLLAATLVAEDNLEIISIWNPTYLLVLLDTIAEHREKLCGDLSRGYLIEGNTKIIFPILSEVRRKILSQSAISWKTLWPRLKLISCWTEGNARITSKKLSALFPAVLMQGKGLLATEAPITIPLIQASACVPLLSDVFFEFEDAQRQVFLLHELKMDKTYEIIISQQGGLYRYRLGDRVKVVGNHFNTPCFEFIGRTADICDLVGEKLNEKFVRDTLTALMDDQAVFAMLLPTIDENNLARYVLLTEPYRMLTDESLDHALSESYHYQNARLLGQLLHARVIPILNLSQRVQNFFITKGMRWGNIKDAVLISDVGLANELLTLIYSDAASRATQIISAPHA
jgi:hypothetical protein